MASWTLDARDLQNTEGENYGGSVTINGTGFHVTAVKVKNTRDGYQEAVDDPYNRLESFFQLDDQGRFETVKIRGLRGEFVVVISPFMD